MRKFIDKTSKCKITFTKPQNATNSLAKPKIPKFILDTTKCENSLAKPRNEKIHVKLQNANHLAKPKM